MKSSLIRITKTAVALIAIVAAGGLLAGAFHSETATAQNTNPSWSQCSKATLEGAYAFRISGETFLPGTNTIDKYTDGVAMPTFDGNGGLTQEDWIVRNGVSDPPPTPGFHGNETGTYTVNPNCTGHAEIDFPAPLGGTSGAVVKLKFVLGNHGRVIHTIVYSSTPPNTTIPVPANIHSDAEKL